MAISHFFSENLFLPFSDLLTGNKINFFLSFLEESQWWSKEKIIEYQNERLRQLIKHSVNTVPYYRCLFKKINLSPNDIQSKNDLYKIPILSKTDIKRQGIDKFTSENYPSKKTIKASSSGSTGEPLYYYNTKEAYSMNIAANLRGWYWIGFRLGDRYVKLSQNPRNNIIKRLQDKFSGNLYLATNPLTDENFELILGKIQKYKPKIIRSYPDPLLFLARHLKQSPKFAVHVEAITTTGNTLYPEVREEIESAFGCKIFDSYSCEGNSNIFECPTHECYHSSEEYGISEVLDDNDKQINDGIGRLISTDLYNFAHPFIRYDTQDFVEVSSEPCSCGRQLLRINRILGRVNDIILSSTGQRFIVHNFTGFFQQDLPELKRSVDQFQVVKNKESTITFNLVINSSFDTSVKDFIKEFWESQLKLPVRINIVNKIPLTESGKRRFIINE